MEPVLRKWCEEHGHDPTNPPFLVRRLRDTLFDDHKVAEVLEVIDGDFCSSCMDYRSLCHCWNEE